ncbi:hypothetical protein D9758_000681 [Tetrapyrgos nigripes]|uniref:Xylanolytic transcriptional activator regulatory domain-containing protein n=1 Tax=Tetrapyrgos nigripes TaxID=182062 RepID=A0A8H5GYU0_9AGAR|nr:hypothetical protein D9758_000681 [Tetrapyrgos nigripes]
MCLAFPLFWSTLFVTIAGDKVCSNCISARKPCTYLEASKPRGPPKAYVTGLEDRVEQIEALLKQLRPDQDFSDELGPPIIRGSWKDDNDPPPKSSTHSASLPAPLSSTPALLSSHLVMDPSPSQNLHLDIRTRHQSLSLDVSLSDHTSDSESSYSSDPDELFDDYEKGMSRLTLRKASHLRPKGSNDARFHGKSSSMKLIDATRRFKQEHISKSEVTANSESGSQPSPSPRASYPVHARRPEYWRASRWELLWEGLHVDSPELLSSVLEIFPPDDLAEDLIQLYFQHVNAQFPLLHRPTFQRQWREKLHNENIWFACVTACLFAVASRWSDDPRVLPQNTGKDKNGAYDWTLAGWDFFNLALEIHRARRSLFYPATLYEIQTFTLLSMFLRGTDYNTVGWLFTTIGIRKAQDVGAHRKTVYKRKPTVDEELWKRAFWLLVAFDRFSSAAIGRACGIAEEDFDLELPLEIDDEFWETEDPSTAFKQPSGVPCKITGFNLWVKLTQIIAFALRALYPHGSSKVVYGRIPIPGPKETVQQLESALKIWADQVPDYLKWSNQIEDLTFANQSATLYTNYYLTQILIYRQFLPQTSLGVSRMTQPPPIPALVLCSNAAKCCARIIETQLQRKLSNIPNLIHISHISAAVLVLHFWDMKAKEKAHINNPGEDVKPQSIQSIQSVKEDIALFIRALEWAAPRFKNAANILIHLRQSLEDETTAPNAIGLESEDFHEVSQIEPADLSIPLHSWSYNHPILPSISDLPLSSSHRDEVPRAYNLPVQPSSLREYDQRYRPPASHHYQHQSTWPTDRPLHAGDRNKMASSTSQHPVPYISTIRRRTASFTDSPLALRSAHNPDISPVDLPDDPGRLDWENGVRHHVPTSNTRSTPGMGGYSKQQQQSGNWNEYPPRLLDLAYDAPLSQWGYAEHPNRHIYPAGSKLYR